MRKLIIFWSGIILAVMVFWNTNCSGNIFGETEVQKFITNWETEYTITYIKKSNGTYISNLTMNITNSRTNYFSWVYQFKPYGQYKWWAFYTNTTNDTETGTYIINQFSDKITLYSSTTLQMTYAFPTDGSLRLKDFLVFSNGTNYPVHPEFSSNYGSYVLYYYDTEFVLKPIIF